MCRSSLRCRLLDGVLRPLVLAASLASLGATSAVRPSVPAGKPIVNVAAFRGQGHLAFLWDRDLFILDGDKGTLWQIARSGQASNLAWSADGRWLAYEWNDNLWLVRADGRGTHQVAGLPGPVTSFSWSPVGDVLAVAPAGTAHAARTLWLASPTGPAHRVAVANAAVLWSPDGKWLGYSLTLPSRDPHARSDALFTVPATGGRPTRRFVAVRCGIWPVRWWPNGQGLLFWIDSLHSASLAADGLGLYTMPLGGSPRRLAYALTYATWLAWSSSGRYVLLVAGAGREAWDAKRLAICDVYAATCRALPQPRGVVSFDPAWAPRGRRIDFVRARDLGPDPSAGYADRSWIRSRTLWVADASGAGARQLTAAGTGIYEPQWSGDGHRVLYVRDNTLWLIDVDRPSPTKILGPFPTAPDLFPIGYYGHVSWAAMLAWSRR